jgi:hypothetical protein
MRNKRCGIKQGVHVCPVTCFVFPARISVDPSLTRELIFLVGAARHDLQRITPIFLPPLERAASVRLREFDGRDGPLAIVASDRNSQAVHFVKQNALHRNGLSVSEDHGFAKELGLGLLELAEDHSRARLHSWQG